MSEQPIGKIEVTISLALSDYLALQKWCRWQCLRTDLLRYAVVVLPFALIAGTASSGSLAEFGRNAWSQWEVLLLLIGGGYLLGVAVPYAGLGIAWLRNKLPRQMGVSIDDTGLTFSMGDHEVSARWSNLLLIAEDRSAYLLRLKSHFLRLPKRAFTSQQFPAFKRLVAANVPVSVIRIDVN
jgi:hypothetical protein